MVDRDGVADRHSNLYGSSYGGPKLVAVDVRFDLRRGAEGRAFITDSGGSNGVSWSTSLRAAPGGA